jgi:serpin B
MVDAFDATKANFSGIEPTKSLFVAQVYHKAFIAIDESGTEAAAATAVAMSGAAAQTPKDFTVDRPFLFFIQDQSGIVMFVGEVANIVNE